MIKINNVVGQYCQPSSIISYQVYTIKDDKPIEDILRETLIDADNLDLLFHGGINSTNQITIDQLFEVIVHETFQYIDSKTMFITCLDFECGSYQYYLYCGFTDTDNVHHFKTITVYSKKSACVKDKSIIINFTNNVKSSHTYLTGYDNIDIDGIIVDPETKSTLIGINYYSYDLRNFEMMDNDFNAMERLLLSNHIIKFLKSGTKSLEKFGLYFRIKVVLWDGTKQDVQNFCCYGDYYDTEDYIFITLDRCDDSCNEGGIK